MNYDALSDQQINSLIASTLGIMRTDFSPCSSIQDAWPLIQEKCVALLPDNDPEGWIAVAYPGFIARNRDSLELIGTRTCSTNPLRAAMISLLKANDQLQLADLNS